MPADNIYFILFETIHDVLKTEKLLKARVVSGEVVPVPRSLSSDCGVCIKSGAPLATLIDLSRGMTGVRYFVFNGVEYRTCNSPVQE